MSNEVAIVAANRTIIGTDNGSLQDLNAATLSIPLVDKMLCQLEKRESSFSRSLIEAFVSGICVESNLGQNLPRQILEGCGIEKTEAAFTVNEMCGSGLEAIFLGQSFVKSNEYPIVLCGGVEMPLATPFYLTKSQLKVWRDKKLEEIEDQLERGDLKDALWCSLHDVHTIVHAENTTSQWVQDKGYDPLTFKEQIDQYAMLSAERALSAIDKNHFSHEILFVSEADRKDEFPRVKKMNRLSRLKGTHFTPDGLFLTSQNSPPLGNGAAYLLLMKREKAEKLHIQPLAVITDYCRAGVDPKNFLLAPIDAVRNLLSKTSTSIKDYDLLEMNTSYGSQMLINREELDLPMDLVNVSGDCIALGHPVGAAGARIVTTLIYGLKRTGGKRGLASICLGGGNALAIAIERRD